MATTTVKVSVYQEKIFESLLKKSVGRDTPLEKLEDYLDGAFNRFDINDGDRVKVLSATISNAVVGITTEAMRNSIVLAEKDAKFTHEVNLIDAQIGELKASARLKDAQAGKVAKEDANEGKKGNLLDAQTLEAKARAKSEGIKGQLYCRQGDYYRTQGMIEKAKTHSQIASMALTNDVTVGEKIWGNVRSDINAIDSYLPNAMSCPAST